MKIYNKLVRDKIPEIISQNGQVCKTAVLSDTQYIKKLDEKLREECAEYSESNEVEELADILEVVFAIAEAKGIKKDELEIIRKPKAESRGSFEKRILLITVDEK